MKQNHKTKVLRRLNIIQGQINGLIKMIEDEKYCIDILIQSNAIKQALTSVENLILENHLTSHVISQIKTGKEEKAIEEILKVYKLSQKINSKQKPRKFKINYHNI